MKWVKKFSRLLETKENLSDTDYSKASHLVTLDGTCCMAMGSIQGGVFLSAFAIALGANNYEIGLIATFTFVSQFAQFPGLLLLKHFKNRKRLAFVTSGLSRLLWLFIILIPILFVSQGVTFLLQWLLISMIIGALGWPAWNSLLRDIIPPRTLGTIISQRLMLGTILSLCLTIAAGFFVDWWKGSFPSWELYAYSIIFSLGLGFGLVGALAIARLPESRIEMDPSEPIAKQLSRPLKEKNFRSLLTFLGIWTFAVNLAGPFFAVYMLKRIGISISMMTLLTVTSQLFNIMFFRIWGKTADRFSNKSVLAISGPLFMIVILAWTFTTLPERYFLTIPLLFVIHAFSGISTAGVSISTANIALKLSPKGYSHDYMTVFGLVVAISGGIAPLIGGAIADFFSVRELSLVLNWSEPMRNLSVYALNFRALDFLFFISFIIGLYSLQKLSQVKEEGEVKESEIISHLQDELSLPLRTITSIEGLRRMVVFPVIAVSKISKGLRFKRN